MSADAAPPVLPAIPDLRVVAWETTRRCPLRCRHCRGSARDVSHDGELDTAEGRKVIDAVAGAGCRLLIFTGGEPMTRPDLVPLLEYAGEKGLRTALAVCGPMLDLAAAKRFRAAGVAQISVSLDGHDAGAHDSFRGSDGAFAATLRALEYARQAGLPFQINTTVTRYNAAFLPRILDLAVRLGAAAWDAFFLVPVGRGKQLADAAMTIEEKESTLRWLAGVREASPIPVQVTCAPQLARVAAESPTVASRPARSCIAGRGFLFISHRGVLQPCGFLDAPCGDLRQAGFDLAGLWRTSPTLTALRRSGDLHGSCGVCAYRSACGGCRARARSATGDMMAGEPECPGRRGPLWLPPAEAAAKLSRDEESLVLHRLQSGLPVETAPFAVLGRELGISAEAVMGCLAAALADGRGRRFGGIFDPARIGYASTLCAVRVPHWQARETAAYLGSVAGVTHCYLRRSFSRGATRAPGGLNLWFTLQAPRGDFAAAWADIVERLHPLVPVSLPAVRRYKVRAVFGGAGSVLPAEEADAVLAPVALTADERLAARILQENLPVAAHPFAAAAERHGMPEQALLDAARKFRQSGALRRIALVARHRLLGYRTNAMVVWDVAASGVHAAGQTLARRPDVTHCYERTPAPGVPGNLFAMFHAIDWPDLFNAIETAEHTCDLSGGTTLITAQEYKKTSMHYAPEVIYSNSK